MSSSAKHATSTWAEFVDLPDEDRRELIDGQLVEVEVPGRRHEHVVMQLGIALGLWARENGGNVYGSGFKVKVSDTRGVMPDVQYYRPGRRPPEKALEVGAPDLVVEVISPGRQRFDRVTKLHYYRELGAPEYWIVDPEARTLERHVLAGDVYQVRDALTDEDLLEPDTFPGLSVRLADVFEEPE